MATSNSYTDINNVTKLPISNGQVKNADPLSKNNGNYKSCLDSKLVFIAFKNQNNLLNRK